MRMACAVASGLMLLMSCASPKASIDYAYSEGILWPGGKERPRIKYLFTVSRISGAETSASDVFVGEGIGEGIEPSESDLLVRPHGVFVSEEDVMYITDPGARRISVINMKTMDSFNITGLESFLLAYPIGVTADQFGRIYVTDADLKGVFVFDGKGAFKYLFEGEFERPTGIVLDRQSGIVYVVDTWAHKVYRYTMDGRRLGEFGLRGEGIGELNYPTHIALDHNGNIYISDTLNFRVQIFSPSGVLIGSFGVLGNSLGAFDKIKGIGVDTFGHIYVADTAQDMINIYAGDGTFLLYFGGTGSFYGKFQSPAGVYVDGRNRIFVVDSLNTRVQAFQFLGVD